MNAIAKTTITLTMTLEEAKALKNIIDCADELRPDESQVQDDLLRILTDAGVK